MTANIVVATTCVAHKCNGREELAWLLNAEELIEDARLHGIKLRFFAAFEIDQRGLEPFGLLLDRFSEIQEVTADANWAETFTTWTYHLDDHATKIDSGNRLIRICMGRNLAHEYAMRPVRDDGPVDSSVTHLLLLDSDITPDADCLPKLLELEHPVVGGNVGVYCMDGPKVDEGNTIFDNPEQAELVASLDVREHWNTAGFLLLTRDVFSRVAWNYDLDAGNTDDPAFQRNTEALGFGPTWVRHDVAGHHVPGSVSQFETRGADTEVRR